MKQSHILRGSLFRKRLTWKSVLTGCQVGHSLKSGLVENQIGQNSKMCQEEEQQQQQRDPLYDLAALRAAGKNRLLGKPGRKHCA